MANNEDNEEDKNKVAEPVEGLVPPPLVSQTDFSKMGDALASSKSSTARGPARFKAAERTEPPRERDPAELFGAAPSNNPQSPLPEATPIEPFVRVSRSTSSLPPQRGSVQLQYHRRTIESSPNMRVMEAVEALASKGWLSRAFGSKEEKNALKEAAIQANITDEAGKALPNKQAVKMATVRMQQQILEAASYSHRPAPDIDSPKLGKELKQAEKANNKFLKELVKEKVQESEKEIDTLIKELKKERGWSGWLRGKNNEEIKALKEQKEELDKLPKQAKKEGLRGIADVLDIVENTEANVEAIKETKNQRKALSTTMKEEIAELKQLGKTNEAKQLEQERQAMKAQLKTAQLELCQKGIGTEQRESILSAYEHYGHRINKPVPSQTGVQTNNPTKEQPQPRTPGGLRTPDNQKQEQPANQGAFSSQQGQKEARNSGLPNEAGKGNQLQR